jgi:hypothetical protein
VNGLGRGVSPDLNEISRLRRRRGLRMMFSVLRLPLFILALVSATRVELVNAAQVVCLQKWGTVVGSVPVDIKEDPAGYVSGDRKLDIRGGFTLFWPSGYRPDFEHVTWD